MRDWLFLALIRIVFGRYPRWQRRWAAFLLYSSPWLTKSDEW